MVDKKKFKFEIFAKDKNSNARVGKFVTPHGVINTPNFMPVATQGSIKSLDGRDLAEIGIQILMTNTYHLHLRPGEDIVQKFAGLHKFMNWNKPLMTDSGGYQVFSLGAAQGANEDNSASSGRIGKFLESREEHVIEKARIDKHREQKVRFAKSDEEGVTFYSHIDGSKHRLDPEISIGIQEKLGADLIVAFDDHELPFWDHERTKKFLERTHRWEFESLKAQKRKDQFMYGVIHGGLYKDLREESARFIDRHFPGIAIGGSYSTKNTLHNVLEWTINQISSDKPVHLLGIGEIEDIFEAVQRGIDTFDCVVPTRLARMGWVFTFPPEGNVENRFRFDIAKSKFADDQGPISSNCNCLVCQNYTRGYIHHLFRSRELLSYRLITYHNLYFFNNLMKEIREAIEIGKFTELRKKWLRL